ncbi:MAG: hypothetical protein AAB906_01375 [Patescibacteria group bacterium]
MFRISFNKFFIAFVLVVFLIGGSAFIESIPISIADNLRLDDQEATVTSIKKAMPAVVSIIVYDRIQITTVNVNTG